MAAINPGIQRIHDATDWGAPAPGSTLVWDGTNVVAGAGADLSTTVILAPATSVRNVIQAPGNPGADLTLLTIKLPAGVTTPATPPFGILDRNGGVVMAFGADGSLGIGGVAPAGRALYVSRGPYFSIEAGNNTNIFQHFSRFSTGNYYGLKFESAGSQEFMLGYDGSIAGSDAFGMHMYNNNNLITGWTKVSRNFGLRRMSAAEYGNAAGCLGIADAITAPNVNPSAGGGVLYSEAGALKWRGPTTGVTVIAPA